MGQKRLGSFPKSKTWRLIVHEFVFFSLGDSKISVIEQNTLRNVQGKSGNLDNDPSIHPASEFFIACLFCFTERKCSDKIVFLNI